MFNNLPSDSETMFFLLNTYFKNISAPIKTLIDFKFDIEPI